MKAAIYPPFDPDMDPESIDDKWSLNHRALANIMYLLTSHGMKMWYMEKHETLIEAQRLFHEMYNPIKQYFDKYLDVPMPTTYMECKFTMRYREYMHWELAYIITDLELSCMKLKEFVSNCLAYKHLDLLAKILNQVKKFENYCVTNYFWEKQYKEINASNHPYPYFPNACTACNNGMFTYHTVINNC